MYSQRKNLGNILIVDDNQDILIAAKLLLKKHYQQVFTSSDPTDIKALLTSHMIDVILLDMNFSQDAISGKEGFHWLQQITQQSPATAVVLMTAYGEIQLAVEAIKAGAADFITKPWQNQQLEATVAAAYNHAVDKQKITQLTRQTRGLRTALNRPFAADSLPFLGDSPAMQRVFNTIDKAASTDANILITGESGTGKELAARAIHEYSLRSDNAFINLDMGALTESLFESELFGHKKGAFTDAKTDKVGRFELAHNGSLFLDEIGNLGLNQQISLLTAIQNRQVTPVGGSHPIDVNIRLIAATNDDLPQAVLDGRFRQDLLYRINTVEIRLPPLRERGQDIVLLANHYLKHYNQKYKRTLDFDQHQLARLVDYPWPGNVRELSHAIERAVILSEGQTIDINHIIYQNSDQGMLSESPGPADSLNNIGESPQSRCFDLEILEQKTVREALKHYRGNVSQAAKALGLTRGAMYRRLEKYDL